MINPQIRKYSVEELDVRQTDAQTRSMKQTWSWIRCHSYGSALDGKNTGIRVNTQSLGDRRQGKETKTGM